MAVELGSEHLCCNHTKQFLYLRDERHCGEPTFDQFGCTDNCPGCANAIAGRKQAMDHSEWCRSRMETILSTTTEGHERLERARDRFAQFAEERGVMKSLRKRHRPEGDGEQPLAPSASGVQSNYQEESSSSSGLPLPFAPPPAPPPLEPPPLAKRSFGTRNRNDRCNRRTAGRIKEAQGASRSASSCRQQ